MLPGRPSVAVAIALLAAVLFLGAHAGVPAAAEPSEMPRGVVPVERYPASFQLAVAEAIELGVARLVAMQAPEGHWGNPEDTHAMGHTALPLLAILKGGTDPSAEPSRRAFTFLRGLEPTSTYGVGCYLMALYARYAPHVDTLDTDVGATERRRPGPEEIRERLSEEDLARLEAGLDYLKRAQASNGLWHYHVQEGARPTGHDLSNTQYAILGLRAVAACGLTVPVRVWQTALKGLLDLQAQDGPKVDLLDWRVRDGYAFRRKDRARARGFGYAMGMKDGPLGARTVPTHPETGSMTTAGIASVLICREGMWRGKRLRGKARRRAADAVRDGLAWLQEHFAVGHNPGKEMAHHLYYLYGLERAGMLAGRRWIGTHDWYREGADVLLAMEEDGRGWGDHVQTSFAVLFLKRATATPQDTPVVTGR